MPSRPTRWNLAFTLTLAALAVSCEGGEEPSDGGARHAWAPGEVLYDTPAPDPRGWLDLRGLIHAHSVYSHDACDGKPREGETGPVNEPCLDSFRRALCRTEHDFVMLTDHNTSFGDSEFPDVLLYREAAGDALIRRDGKPVANRAACPDGGHPVLVMAGTESATVAVGLESHVSPDVETRHAVYGDATAEAIETMKAHGAISLLMHTDEWTVEQITTLPVDGFEMYNLHANALRGAGGALSLITKLRTPEELPQSDLVFLPIVNEDPRYTDTWGSVLATGARRVTTMATDCHENTFPQILPDGERIDSYRRMMLWFSNHLLVRPKPDGSWDDTSLKDALRAGRLYGAFEIFGYPHGFDYHAAEGGAAREMGESASLAAGATLHVTRPSVSLLDRRAQAPIITVKLLRAREGGWDTVAEGQGDLDYTPAAPGAYRAEVRIVPRHLREYLASYAELADQDFVWIYANPIYVTE